jgi:hypothetical protein
MPHPQQIDLVEVTPPAEKKPRAKKAEIVKIEKSATPANPVATSDTAAILGMVERMMFDPAVTPERANQALDFALKLRSEQARMAFDEAVAAAKAEIKPVHRNAVGHNNKRYADFAAIAREVDPIIGKYGLTYRFRSAQEGNQISITCRLAHKGGHAEETTLAGPTDTTGNKNAMQAIGSSTTYLQRFTLVLMLGLAASNDDDGKAAAAVEDGPISDAQLAELIALADEVGADKAKFCRFYEIESFAEIRTSQFEKAKSVLNEKRKAPK